MSNFSYLGSFLKLLKDFRNSIMLKSPTAFALKGNIRYLSFIPSKS